MWGLSEKGSKEGRRVQPKPSKKKKKKRKALIRTIEHFPNSGEILEISPNLIIGSPSSFITLLSSCDTQLYA